MTPLFRPLWWAPTRGSFSSTTTRSRGKRPDAATAVARPMMPPPMIARSARASLTRRQHRGLREPPGSEDRFLDRLAVLVLRGRRGNVPGGGTLGEQLYPLHGDVVDGRAGTPLQGDALGDEDVLVGVRPDGVGLVVRGVAESVGGRLEPSHLRLA